MATNSTRNDTHKVLGTNKETRLKAFLLDCVNLPNPIDYPGNEAHFERWLNLWGKSFTYRADVEGESKTTRVPREQLEMFAPIIRTTLARLWDEQDERQRDWYCFRMRDAHRQMIRWLEGAHEALTWGGRKTVSRWTDYDIQEVPRSSPFEVAAFWLQHHPGLTRVCENPGCEAPYYFRGGKRQSFCSPECADVARKAAKLRWWNESPNSPKNRKPSPEDL